MSKPKPSTRRHNLMTVVSVVLLISPISLTMLDFVVAADVISGMGIEILQGTRHLSSGVYLSNITFTLDVRVSSADPIFSINITDPLFELTVDGYDAGFFFPQNLISVPLHNLYYSLKFTLGTDPALTDYIMSSRANNLELAMSGLASASFYRHFVFVTLTQSWNWNA